MKVFTPFANLSAPTRIGTILATWLGLFGFWLGLAHQNPIIPHPLQVLSAWKRLLVENELILRLWESYCLNLEALGISIILSFGLAYLSVVPATRPFVRGLTKLRFLGFTGMTFFFGLYFEGRMLQVWLLVFGMSVFFLTSMVSIVNSVSEEDLDYARTLRMGPWQTTYEMIIRGTLDTALDSLRQNAAMAWVMLTMVEGLVRSEGGVGVLLIDQSRHLRLDAIIALQATILLVGLMQDYLLGLIRLILCPYAHLDEE